MLVGATRRALARATFAGVCDRRRDPARADGVAFRARAARLADGVAFRARAARQAEGVAFRARAACSADLVFFRMRSASIFDGDRRRSLDTPFRRISARSLSMHLRQEPVPDVRPLRQNHTPHLHLYLIRAFCEEGGVRATGALALTSPPSRRNRLPGGSPAAAAHCFGVTPASPKLGRPGLTSAVSVCGEGARYIPAVSQGAGPASPSTPHRAAPE